MLKRIKLTLDEILKTRFKEELIPPWILKKINLARLNGRRGKLYLTKLEFQCGWKYQRNNSTQKFKLKLLGPKI